MGKGTTVKRTNPGDAANIFVRCMLSDLSDMLGGFTQDDLQKTVEFFEYKCPYTGDDITDIYNSKKWSLDHLIPHNRDKCGLNLYGNIIVTSPNTNSKKSSMDFKKFILEKTTGTSEEKEARIAKILQFQEESGYIEKVGNISKLSDLCKEEYELIQDKLTKLSKEYLPLINRDEIITDEEDIPDSTDDIQISTTAAMANQNQVSSQITPTTFSNDYFVGKAGKQRAFNFLTSLGYNISANMNIGKSNKSRYMKYWANPELTCLNSDWTLILNDNINKELHIFQIPAGAILPSDLVTRNDNNKIDLQIRYADSCFEDTRSKYCFYKWYSDTVQY